MSRLRVILIDGDGCVALFAYECESWNRKDDAPKLHDEICIEFDPIAVCPQWRCENTCSWA